MAARSNLDECQRERSDSPPARRHRKVRRRLWQLVAACALAAVVVWFGRPAAVWWQLTRAQRAIAEYDPETAIARLEWALAVDGKHAETHFWLARAHRRRGAMDQVRAHIERAWELGFPTERLNREQYLAMAQSGQMRAADPHLPGLLMNPGDDGREICEAYVNGYFVTCRFAEAFRLLDVWQAEFPDDAQPYKFRALFAVSLGDMRTGAEHCRSALERAPDRRDLQLALATCLSSLHEFEEAERMLERILHDDPDNIAALGVLAEDRLEQGDAEGAERCLSRLLALDPANLQGRITRARTYAFNQRAEEAVTVMRDIVRERPYDVESRFVLATALRAAGETELAASEFAFVQEAREELQRARMLKERVIEDEPENAELRYEVGRILLRYESPETGAGWLRSVLEIAPRHQGAHQALAEYHAAMGHHEIAEFHRSQMTGTE